MRKGCIAVLLMLAAASVATAQTPEWRFRWQQGQTLQYVVEHTTSVAEVVSGNKVETKSHINLVKRWQVLAVDAQGVATLQMSIAAMRNEQTRPSGDVVVYDSREPDKSTPAMREQMEKFINQPLAVLRVDPLGKVVEVSKGPSNRYESEPPFSVVLPGAAVGNGKGWDRNYTITLDPPLGTGEKHAATQHFTCAKVADGLATFTFTTAVAKMPADKVEQLPLLQKLPQGAIVFDVGRGRLQSVALTIDQQVQGHQGEGSSYHFQSSYTERIAE